MRKVLTSVVLGLALIGCGSEVTQQADEQGMSAAECKRQYDGAGFLDSDGDCIDGLPNSNASQEEAEQASQDVEEAIEEAPPEPELAKIGDSITLNAGNLGIKATVVSVTDPIEPYVDPYLGEAFDRASPGNRLFGVTLRLKNIGSETFDPGVSGTASLVMRNDQAASEASLVDTKPWSDYVDAKLAPGSSLVLNFPYEGANGRKPGRFQYEVYSNDFTEATAEWLLR
jgi:hypothetical protein